MYKYVVICHQIYNYLFFYIILVTLQRHPPCYPTVLLYVLLYSVTLSYMLLDPTVLLYLTMLLQPTCYSTPLYYSILRATP